MKDPDKRLLYYLIGIFMGAFVFGYFAEQPKQLIQTEIKPCVCVTYSQYALWSEKYNRFVSENKPDSVAKYAELLNQIK